MFTHRVAVALRAVEYGDVPSRSRGEVDVLKACAGSTNELQRGQQIEEFGVHTNAAAQDDAIGVTVAPDGLNGRLLGAVYAGHARSGAHFRKDRVHGIKKEHLHVVRLTSARRY